MNKFSAFVTLLAFSQFGYGKLVVLADTGNTQPAKPYVQNILLPTEGQLEAETRAQLAHLKDHKIQMNQMLYPAKSTFTQGRVVKHQFDAKHFAPNPIFIIGSDKQSVRWAKENAGYLKQIYAFGVITNVQDAKTVKQIESKTGLTLIPVNLKGLSKIIGTHHYPVLIDHGWVLQ